MTENITVLIGIQARTNSTRLPNKAMKRLVGTTSIDHVVNLACKSKTYMNKYSDKTGITVQVWVLVPEGDPLQDYLSSRRDIKVYAGSENDLIERYKGVADIIDPDYIVRITGDCPKLPPFLITKAINCTKNNRYDFLDNAAKDYRTFFDGADVEVMSKKAFNWLYENAKEREHVCHDLRENPPEWLGGENRNRGFIGAHWDQSFIKLSIDTQKDFDLVANQMKSVTNKKRKFEDTFGRGTYHVF